MATPLRRTSDVREGSLHWGQLRDSGQLQGSQDGAPNRFIRFGALFWDACHTAAGQTQGHAYLAPGRGTDPPLPVVSDAPSGIHFLAFRSKRYPCAPFSTSLVVFMMSCHLLSLFLKCTASNATATSFSLMPRKPPTPMIKACAFSS